MGKVWIVGNLLEWRPIAEGSAWEFSGVFDTEEKAVAACRNEKYFVGPATLNEILPAESTEWPGCYYPHLTTAKGIRK